VNVAVGSSNQDIRLRLQNYGTDLFSMRLKYPVVTLAQNGTATIQTAMPSTYQGAYIQKTSTTFSVKQSDGTVIKSFTLSNYTDVDGLVEALKADSTISANFEIIKYGCEGVAFTEIADFDKIYLSKYIDEIQYLQASGSSDPIYTGAHYWDAYPVFIRTSDVGYEHSLKFNYRIVGGVVKSVYVSLDGMYVRFKNLNVSESLVVHANTSIVSSVDGLSIMPYKRAITPMLSMQHGMDVQDHVNNPSIGMHTSTMRQYDMLAYLKKKGFVGENYGECMDTIRGTRTCDNMTYCLTFDDRQCSFWRTDAIRNLFNMFRAKPTLIYLFSATDFDSINPPDPNYFLTKDEYDAMKKSGWDIVTHGFCMHTDLLSYAQFYNGFSKHKADWMRWYGEDVQSYNAHGDDIMDYQFYLLKHMGFGCMSSGSAANGWFCEAGCKVDVEYKRVVWMDSELAWSTVKSNIDSWIE
jgi:hypothetical protein